MAKSKFTNLECQICKVLFSGSFCRRRKTCSRKCTVALMKLNAGRPQGIPHTAEWKEEASKRILGEKNYFFGKKFTRESNPEYYEKRIQFLPQREMHWKWIKDRSQLKDDHRDRGGSLHREWSKEVKKIDGWKCRIANHECSGIIVAHHILSWRAYPELRYEVNNGITLCHLHHPRKRNDEVRLETLFKELVSTRA